ncbi:MAG: tRNA pseudouridine(38-40) synthase TruA [Actinomycetia bacterium]|nr:tRNA pseudouridine(38-40) synthase TruA [Actinomycetes bacterium]MCP4221751.1 tRNA pseudouridine(38-40) synthase TruA [Actinomycetes bacterium]
MLVAYDGTGFRGLAPNEGVRTVVGELQAFLIPLVGYEPKLVMSGRTDAGVHAWGQVLSTDLPADADLARIQRSVNAKFGPEIVLREVAVASDSDFSARYSATGRRYRYTVVNRDVPDPFLARTAWWVPNALDLEVMNEAATEVVGEHDFSSFCRRPKGDVDVSLVRRVTAARWHRLDPPDVLRFDIDGSAFCHQMVRSIVGYLVAVGHGRRSVDDLIATLAARDRAAAVQPAPPHGLCLWQVDYDT